MFPFLLLAPEFGDSAKTPTTFTFTATIAESLQSPGLASPALATTTGQT